ncbi:MAG: RNA polymerase sigma factor [Bacteroidaceae bacterium]|nr:RNA polymerase sigma factor [Bacteroidaceae bacterium]
MRHTNDTLLISRVMLFDDRRAFATLVEQHQPTIRRFFLHQTMGDEMLSDDLAQETFIKLYYSIKQFKGLANLSTYLYRIAYNVLQDHLRRNRFTHTTDIIPECVISTHNDTHIDITRALQQLTPTERAAITLYYIDDRKVEDVASILQLPAGTVKSHLSRARNKIADFLKNNGYE